MATTSFATGANLTAKVWSSQVFVEGLKNTFFQKFMSESGDSIIHVKKDLTKQAGDSITVPLVMQLSGDGVAGDSTLEGSEEALTFYDCSVPVNQQRFGVLLAGAMTEMRVAFDLRKQAKDRLRHLFTNYFAYNSLANLTTAAPATEIPFAPTSAGTAITTITSITAGDNKLTCSLISKARRTAMLHAPKVMPVRVEGKDYFVLLVHPYAAKDLKTDTTWLNANYYAAERGSSNPLFTGMLGIYDGVVLYEYERTVMTTEGASSAKVCKNLLLGRQAGLWGIGKPMFWKEKSFDYENQSGFAVGYIGGIVKTKFNSKDFGVIQVATGGEAG